MIKNIKLNIRNVIRLILTKKLLLHTKETLCLSSKGFESHIGKQFFAYVKKSITHIPLIQGKIIIGEYV